MNTHSDSQMSIEERLSYWKWDFTSLDLFSGELAYSLIFDNIRPDRVLDALQTVGLTVLPNYFLLIQIDDYAFLSSKLEITREFFQKDLVVNTIRDYLKELQLSGFAANLINTDQVICFLCLEGWEPIAEFLSGFITELRRRVRLHTSYTLSVCVSGRCSALSQFSPMYAQMERALGWSFYYGQGANLSIRDGQLASAAVDLQKHFTDLLAAVSQRGGQRIQQRVDELFQALNAAKPQPQQVRIEVVRLVHQFEGYCTQCAVPERTAAAVSGRCAEQVLSCQFFSRIRELFLEFCQQIAAILEQYDSNPEHRFKVSVQAYIRAHYSRPVWLEEIAQAFNFSPCYFTQVFRQHFGMTLNQYLTQVRVDKSRELLEHSCLPIEDIAYLSGFNSCSYFCATFKRVAGITPKGYRQSCVKAALSKGD